mmetsp:Transcript_10589/g.33846  ORF Transcript_10589/g.33846 Transcript_10589/m.33846 type:complete len:227 (+) Transcript_10589:128-808(+)
MCNGQEAHGRTHAPEVAQKKMRSRRPAQLGRRERTGKGMAVEAPSAQKTAETSLGAHAKLDEELAAVADVIGPEAAGALDDVGAAAFGRGLGDHGQLGRVGGRGERVVLPFLGAGFAVRERAVLAVGVGPDDTAAQLERHAGVGHEEVAHDKAQPGVDVAAGVIDHVADSDVIGTHRGSDFRHPGRFVPDVPRPARDRARLGDVAERGRRSDRGEEHGDTEHLDLN